MSSLDLRLSQNVRKKKSWRSTSAPDTDSNFLDITNGGSTNVTPDLEFSHNFIKYTAPVGNVQPVTINGAVNWEDRSHVVIRLDNSNNTGSKTFTFDASYDFLDNPGINNYTLTAGSVRVWYGSIFNGRICLRESVDSKLV